MTDFDIPRRRLQNQHLAGNPLADPVAVVRWFGAVQAQDFSGAKWALAQRTPHATNACIDALFDQGAILRTHVLRPTWHFVAPDDIRWLLALTAPRVHAQSVLTNRKLELDAATLRRSKKLITKALSGGRQLTRTELAERLERAGIAASGVRLAHLIMHAELEALICSGSKRGKQFTYALLDERVPPAKHEPTREEALAELTLRFYASHGPATLHDYAWWSSLTMTDAKIGVELIAAQLDCEQLDGRKYWFRADAPAAPSHPCAMRMHLLPNYDEHLIAYRDASHSFEPSIRERMAKRGDVLSSHVVTRNGRVVGGWRRTEQKTAITMSTELLAKLNRAERAALRAAADAYGRFMALPVRMD